MAPISIVMRSLWRELVSTQIPKAKTFCQVDETDRWGTSATGTSQRKTPGLVLFAPSLIKLACCYWQLASSRFAKHNETQLRQYSVPGSHIWARRVSKARAERKEVTGGPSRNGDHFHRQYAATSQNVTVPIDGGASYTTSYSNPHLQKLPPIERVQARNATEAGANTVYDAKDMVGLSVGVQIAGWRLEEEKVLEGMTIVQKLLREDRLVYELFMLSG
ncbi:hypothetical protein BD779DRAFT_1476848 [Infundibulicybe gibba]|nr:hypothetical protein BD779DRAFT_1476848 [Infundibulicybe gibba]